MTDDVVKILSALARFNASEEGDCDRSDLTLLHENGFFGIRDCGEYYSIPSDKHLGKRIAELSTLRAEIEALREALQPFVDFYEGALASYSKGYEERMLADPNTHTIYGWNTEELTHPMFGKARAALSPKES